MIITTLFNLSDKREISKKEELLKRNKDSFTLSKFYVLNLEYFHLNLKTLYKT